MTGLFVSWEKRHTDKDLESTLERERTKIDELLFKQGAILFRGFDINSPYRFREILNRLPGSYQLEYVGGNSPRTQIQPGIFTSTDYPAHYFISLHSELSYAPAWPKYIYFCCVVAPTEGGCTILADNRRLFQEIPEQLSSKFANKGVKYIRNLKNSNTGGLGKSWQETFETEDKEKVEAVCRRQAIDFHWKKDGSIKISERRTGVINHWQTGERVWFNQAEQFHPSTHPEEVYNALKAIYTDGEDMPQYACFGDGTPITDEELSVIRHVAEKNTVPIKWEVGDLLVLDNELISHGRQSFRGDRYIIVGMSDSNNS